MNNTDERTWDKHGDESYDFGEHDERQAPTKADKRIEEDLNSRLTDDAYVDASNIEVTVDKGVVILNGTVVDNSSKHRAEDIAALVSGVSNVENRLQVK